MINSRKIKAFILAAMVFGVSITATYRIQAATVFAETINVSSGTAEAFAETKYYTYRLAQINTTVEIPQDFLTFTRQTTSADPNLSKIGASAEQLRALMDSSDTYLETMPENMSYEIVISGTTTDEKNFSELTDAELSECVAKSISSYGEADDDILFDISTYKTGDYTYIVADFKTTTDTVVYSRSYYTIAQGRAITIALQTKLPGKGDANDSTTYEFDDELVNQLKSIVDSARYSEMKVGITDTTWFNEITGYLFGIIVTIGGLGLVLFLMIKSTSKAKRK